MSTPGTIIFAIRAGLQLSGALRKAYVDATIGRPLVLPLPRSAGIDHTSALTWFTGSGAEAAAKYPRVGDLLRKQQLTGEDKAELTELYRVIRTVARPDEPDNEASRGLIGEEDLAALLTVRQWEKGIYGDGPTALQRVGGTLVNVAVDYFRQNPGAISDKRAEGRALETFLTSLDRVDFSTAAVSEMAPDLMIAVLESVAGNPDLIGGGEKEQKLVRNVTETLGASARDLLADAPSQERREASLWLQMLARSLIEGGAKTVLANPQRFLGVKDGEAALLGNVGGAVSELLLGEERVTFRNLLSSDGLQTVVSAALDAVAQNPDLIKTGNKGIRNLLVSIASDLAKYPRLASPDLFPELARLLLEKSAANLDLVWGKAFSSPDRHLLLAATRTVLSELGRKPPRGTTWKPVFTQSQVLEIVEGVADEVLDNPQWLVKHAGEAAPRLGVALGAVLESLRKHDDTLISAQTGTRIIRSAIRTAALNVLLLEKLPDTNGDTSRIALAFALDAVLDSVFNEDAPAHGQWKLARNSALAILVDIGLNALTRAGATRETIAVLQEAVEQTLVSETAFNPVEFERDLERKFQLS